MADKPKRGTRHDPPTNALQPGNQIWKLRGENIGGPPRTFETADELWDAAVAYFEWVEENPLQEEKLFHHQGNVTRATVNKMRAMTIAGMCLHMGISDKTWWNWRNERGPYHRADLADTCDAIDAIIREQKFTGAAADLLNPLIIARDLGLADKQELSGPGGKPMQTITKTMTPQEAAEAYAGTLSIDGE